jgi:hypothetical protein
VALAISLVLAATMLGTAIPSLPGAPAANQAYAADVTATGVDLTTARQLTIWAKDSLAITQSPDQQDYMADSDADALANKDSTKFKVTKITPATTDLSYVRPSNPSTFTAIHDAYVQSNNGQVVIDFSSPYDLSNATPNKDAVKVTQGSVSGTENGSYVSGDTINGKSYVEQFVDHTNTVQPGWFSADGVYMIEAIGSSGWWAVVEVPTYTRSTTNSLNSTTNYQPVVYAKLKEALKPEFNSYVNIISKDGTNNTLGSPNAARFGDMTKWEKDGITKGTYNTFTAAFTMNGLADEYDYSSEEHSGNKMGNVAFGFAYTDASTISLGNVIVQGSSDQQPGWSFPSVTVTKNAGNSDKIFTVRTNMEIGIIASKVDDPTSAVYAPILNWEKSSGIKEFPKTSICNMLMAYGYANNTNSVALSGTDSVIVANTNTTTDVRARNGLDVYVYPSTPNAQANIAEAVANAIIDGDGTGASGNITANGTLPASFTSGATLTALQALNTSGYTTAEQLLSGQSDIKIEVAITSVARITGTAFTAGARDSEGKNAATDIRPFLYGSTYSRGSGTNYPTPKEHDFATFMPTGTASGSTVNANQFIEKKPSSYAYIYTGAVNGVKVDQDGVPLAGAKFLLMKRVGTTNTYAKADTSFNVNGPVFDVTTPTAGTGANCYVATTDSEGKIIFNGLDPDAIATENDTGTDGKYWLVELAPPTGYKDLPHDTVAGETNYGGSLVPALTMSWAEQKAASILPQADPGYVAMTKVINVPTLALPNTGGPGLAGILCVGAALMGTSVYIRRRTRRANLKDGEER